MWMPSLTKENDYYLVKHENGVTLTQARKPKHIRQLLDLKKEHPNGWEPLRDENIYLTVVANAS